MKLNRMWLVVWMIGMMVVLPGTHQAWAQKKRSRRYDCSGKIARAADRFHKKKYNEVKTILDQVKMHCGSHDAMDTALYYLGRACLELKQHNQASMEFDVLQQDFPNSSFREEVYFLQGICSYRQALSYERDQSKTRDAMREFVEMIDLFPASPFADSARHYLAQCNERLAKKEFMNARFYERIDQYDAAIVYFRMFMDEFPESGYIPESKLSLARVLFKAGRPKEAETVIDDLLAMEEQNDVKDKARLLLDRIKKQDGFKIRKKATEPPPADASAP